MRHMANVINCGKRNDDEIGDARFRCRDLSLNGAILGKPLARQVHDSALVKVHVLMALEIDDVILRVRSAYSEQK
jgi:hypothetical protein